MQVLHSYQFWVGIKMSTTISQECAPFYPLSTPCVPPPTQMHALAPWRPYFTSLPAKDLQANTWFRGTKATKRRIKHRRDVKTTETYCGNSVVSARFGLTNSFSPLTRPTLVTRTPDIPFYVLTYAQVPDLQGYKHVHGNRNTSTSKYQSRL